MELRVPDEQSVFTRIWRPNGGLLAQRGQQLVADPEVPDGSTSNDLFENASAQPVF